MFQPALTKPAYHVKLLKVCKEIVFIYPSSRFVFVPRIAKRLNIPALDKFVLLSLSDIGVCKPWPTDLSGFVF